jgi:formylglycine-generating enzyme required for sulfatase activity/transcriptional regulator with XRE-family HTH domain
MKQPQTFAEWIGHFIDRSGITQSAIERRMGLRGKGTLSKWRSEEVGQPRRENLDAFADVLRLAPQERATLLELAGYQVTISPTLDAPDYAAARRRYLEALRGRYNVIETHAYTALAQDDQVGSPRRPSLLGDDGVYVPLLFDAPAARLRLEMADGLGVLPEHNVEKYLRKLAEQETPPTSMEWEAGPLPLADVLQFPHHLAIVGDAGSGKTTILHVIVSALAAKDPAAIAPDLAPILPDLHPIPIFLPLRLFEHACALDDANIPNGYTRCASDLLRFVDDWFTQWCPDADLPSAFLADHIRAGRAWLLLDALDEVPDPTHRETVRNVIQDLADQLRGTRLLVTARVAAYRDTRLDDRFAVVTVRDLDEEQRTRMVHTIYGGLALSDAPRRAADLADRFAHSEALRDLARTPVMVWTAAVIHALRGELPEGRAALYDAYVDILLKQSFKRSRYDTASVDELADGQGWPLPDRRHYLTYAAFQAHNLLETQPERRGDRHVVVGEDELADHVLARYFHHNLGQPMSEARRRARQFLTLMVERSGLLYETDQGYTIGDHLTMQEFLAGCYLGEHYPWEDPQGYADFLKQKVGRSWWREVFLLAAGYLAEKPGFAARQFLQQIAQQGTGPEGQLTVLALAGRGLLQLRARMRRPTWYTGLAQNLAGRLYSLLYAEPAPAPVTARHEAGLVLGLLYGYPGQDALTDPRFAHPLGLPAFVPIEKGGFWMGQDDSPRKDERPRHRVHLDAYEIARYPTTNAMFAHFIAADGYEDERWWAEAIADGYWKDGRIRDWLRKDWYDLPRYWSDSGWNNPSQPVVGVNWYEAVAYCRWLTAALDDGHEYRLPTEAQWERAAQGSGEARYPWGDDWRDDHCNSEETGLGVTSPVGIFPQGAAEGAIHDMVGNVWEWCWDWYGEDYYAHSQDADDPTGPEQGEYRVLRGGYWGSTGPSFCRCGFRCGSGPWVWNYGRGFRCVRISPS